MTMYTYVEVQDNVGDDESVELPAEKNGTLLLSTVAAVFPGTIGLRYQGGSGLWRACRMVENVIDPPLEGWGTTVFQVVRQGTKRQANLPNKLGNHPNNKALVLASDGNKQVVVHGERPDAMQMAARLHIPDLMVSDLPISVQLSEVRAYFERFGELEQFTLKYNPDGKPKGYGFLKYKEAGPTKDVLNTTHAIHHRMIGVSPTKRSMQMLELGFGIDCMPTDNASTKLFVGRLPNNVTESDLKEIFKNYSVKSVHLPQTGGKGCGFVTLTSIKEAFKVMNDNHMFKGKQLNVSTADKRAGTHSNWDYAGEGEETQKINIQQWMLQKMTTLSKITPEQRLRSKIEAQRNEVVNGVSVKPSDVPAAPLYDYGYGNRRDDIGNTNSFANLPPNMRNNSQWRN